LMMERLRMHVGIAIGVAISLLALALALRWSGLEPLRYALLEIDYRYLGLAIMIFLASMVARAFCWRTLLGSSLSLWRVLAALNQGYLLNNVLPWRMGEIGRAILLGRRPGMTVPGVLSSIMVERLYDIILALSLFLGLLPLAIGLPGVLQSATLGSVVLVVALISLLVVLIKPEFVERVLLKLPGGSRIWQPFWLRFGEGLKSLRNPRVVMVVASELDLSWNRILARFESLDTGSGSGLGIFHAHHHPSGSGYTIFSRVHWSVRSGWYFCTFGLRCTQRPGTGSDARAARNGLYYRLGIGRPGFSRGR
jgi:uncharacterized membrane protein YbhN (UPF0104 family)